MLIQKVKWKDGSISSSPNWLVDVISKLQDVIILDEVEVKSTRVDKIIKELPEDFLPLKANYKPIAFLDTNHVNALENKDQWLEARRSGIGGSESATARGFGKYQSMLSLYWDKTKDERYQPMDESSNWEILDYGHRLEPWIRNVFSMKTRMKAKEVPIMFRHSLFPYMLADIDGIAQQGNFIYGFEAKTTNPEVVQRKWNDNQVPPEYIAQVRHYMAVVNIDIFYIACGYGNTRNDVIIRKIYRDYADEMDMVIGEGHFWKMVQDKKEPNPTDSENNYTFYDDFRAIKKRRGRKVLPYDQNMVFIENLNELEAKKKEQKKEMDATEKEIKRLKAIFMKQMQEDKKMFSKAEILDDKHNLLYQFTFTEPNSKEKILSAQQEALSLEEPEIFEKYATVTTQTPSLKLKCFDLNK